VYGGIVFEGCHTGGWVRYAPDRETELRPKPLIEIGASRFFGTCLVPAPGQLGVLDVAGDGAVQSFREEPDNEIGSIYGGFFVLREPTLFDYIDGDATSWQRTPLERLAREGELMAYRHTGFWKPMETLRDKRELEALWADGKAPWKTW
jgi:glucose-1-phosphate cytidylyltransferase